MANLQIHDEDPEIIPDEISKIKQQRFTKQEFDFFKHLRNKLRTYALDVRHYIFTETSIQEIFSWLSHEMNPQYILTSTTKNVIDIIPPGVAEWIQN
jgi:hydroxymethylpyrimidine pyrophosphatase-like HAD family hydrolase